ncbi:MAG TPA: SDR family NAD(P)-dependent oxidoreductase [Solirubrobacteraceae bacterium]|jgi:decaprenylphospho-beta-D-ribofuranose 2-oxidase|nr:SDR family NAD(P)-dependent oxidoreductase [Solirubrobacteraceae bacterium]
MPLTEAGTIAGRPAVIHGWGGGDRASVTVLTPRDEGQLRAALARCRSSSGAIARGLGRSYGDAAQLAGGHVLDMSGLRGFVLDEEQGTVTVQAGVTLGELIASLVPRGWMLPVVPGTQHVTVGGAIASDVHGKNHATAGTFSRHVRELVLLTAAGEMLELEPGAASGLFEATTGGMGLTGLVVSAEIALVRVGGAMMSVDTDRARDLDEAMALLAGPGGPHRVAWLDLLGSSSGRGVVTRAAYAPDGAGGARDGAAGAPAGAGGAPESVTVRAGVTVPERWPAGVLRASTVRAYNELRYRRAPRHERGRDEGLGAHMFPLDALGAWPRLYGPEGLLQYQFVVPAGQEQVLHSVLAGLRRARVPCFLAVLKDLGPGNDAPLSFPIAGWTLALDLPRAARGVGALLDGFDELVAAAGGRVYLTKDARVRPDAVQAMYPRLAGWQEIRESTDPEGLWRSDLALRTGLVRGRRHASSAPAEDPAPQRVLVLGGSSEIGLAIVRRLARDRPVRAHLVGRDHERLEWAGHELAREGIAVGPLEVLDAADTAAHAGAIARVFEQAGGFDVVVLAVGVLGAQEGLDADPALATEVMDVNFLGSGSLLLHALRALRDQRHGTLVVLSSVAGERVRSSNPVYGAAKAGLDALAQGLADAAAGSGARVLVVRPGFVHTRMTEGLPRAPLATTPEAVADATVAGLAGRAHTIWVPRTLRPLFAVLRHLPRPVFRRLPL